MFGAGILALPNIWYVPVIIDLARFYSFVFNHFVLFCGFDFSNDVGAPLAIIIYILVSCLCSVTCHLLVESRRIALKYAKDDDLRQLDHTEIVSMSDNSPDSFDSMPLLIGGHLTFQPEQEETENQNNISHENDSARHKLITYADVARTLIGNRAGTTIEFVIIILHVLFATGLVICILDTAEDLFAVNEKYYRYIFGMILFPLLAALSQISWLHDLWQLSAIALSIYTLGVIGCSVYSSISVNHAGNRPAPDDAWDFHWDGVFTFTGTAVYALEGIGLVLPTAYSMTHPEDASKIVCSGVLSYGLVTITYAIIVYLGGGGGLEKDDDCDIVVNCIGPDALKSAVQIMLVLALVMTHPVFLFPATEMLEVKITKYIQESHETSNFINTDDVVSLADDDSTYIAHETISSPGAKIIMKMPKLRVGLVSISIIIGSIVTSFDSFSAFVGSILLVFAGFLLPVVLYYKARILSKDPLDNKTKTLLVFIFIFGAVLMTVGGISSFLDMIG